jgi:hypothetical protein
VNCDDRARVTVRLASHNNIRHVGHNQAIASGHHEHIVCHSKLLGVSKSDWWHCNAWTNGAVVPAKPSLENAYYSLPVLEAD